MTLISPLAEAARENARQATGQFGEQQHSAPDVALDAYTFPPLSCGRHPSEIGINIWESDDGEFTVATFEWGIDEFGEDNADLSKPLSPARTLALPGELSKALAGGDIWTTLDEAPVWLQDIVTTDLVDRDALHPDKRHALEAWSQQRLDRIPGEPFATSLYNDHLLTFETDHPAGTPQDAVEGMYELEGFDDYSVDHPDREAAAAELSRRAFGHLGGALVDANRLLPGDRVELAGLEEYLPAGFTDTRAVVTRGTGGAYGEYVTLTVNDNTTVELPYGAHVAAEGYSYEGRTFTTRQLVEYLIRQDELPAGVRSMATPAHAIDAFIGRNVISGRDTEEPQPLNPSPTNGAHQ